MTAGIGIALIVALCAIFGCGIVIFILVEENNSLAGEVNCAKDCARDEATLLNEHIQDLTNQLELEKIANDNLRDKCADLDCKCTDLDCDVEKLNESIDSLMNENHQLHAAVYKPRKCPFCGGDVDITINKGSIKNVHIKHKQHMTDCPLNEGFMMCATNKIDAVSKWNTRVCG